MNKVWFNHGMALLEDILKVIRAAGADDISIVASRQEQDSSIAGLSDEFHVEPQGLEQDDYVKWCLGFALANAIRLFVPSRQMSALSAARDLFADHGINVLVPASPEVLSDINHKGALYRRLLDTTIPIPKFLVVSTFAELKQAYLELRQTHERVCFKPATAVFGHGFRLFTDNSTAYERMLKSGVYTASYEISMDEAEFVLGRMDRFDDLIVMPYLEGPERSVDCLASNGKLVTCLIRLKDSHDGQLIEDNPQIRGFVEIIARELELDGMFNVQFRDGGGIHYLLESNPRWSGGLHKACMASGFPLPLWGLKVGLGLVRPEDVPAPKTGGRVVRKTVYEIISP